MDRSLRFRVYPTRLIALLGLAFAPAPPFGLTLPRRVTRRPIMQKVRGHTFRQAGIVLPLLVGVRFQVLFHSPIRSTFHLSLTVLVHYRSLESYLALPDGTGRFRQDFSGPALLRILHVHNNCCLQGCHLLWPFFPKCST